MVAGFRSDPWELIRIQAMSRLLAALIYTDLASGKIVVLS